jgi:hypothetical protein
LREIERRLGLADRLANCLVDPRAPERVVHRLAEIIRFRMLMIAAGFEDGNDADALRRDPMFKLALDRLPAGEELCLWLIRRAVRIPVSRHDDLDQLVGMQTALHQRLGFPLPAPFCPWGSLGRRLTERR